MSTITLAFVYFSNNGQAYDEMKTMNNEQITKQILEKFKKKQIGWLQLDTSFENYIDQQELSAVNDFYVDHREGENHKGWQSCCQR